MRDYSEASLVTKVAVDHCENSLTDEPLQHVKYSWRDRSHDFSTRLEGFTVATVFP